MMLDWLGETEKAQRLEDAVADVINEGKVRTYDMGGTATHSGDGRGHRGAAVGAVHRGCGDVVRTAGGPARRWQDRSWQRSSSTKSACGTACRWRSRSSRPSGKPSGSRALVDSGVDIVQLGSFVHPEKVPQMADTDALFERFARRRRAGRQSGPSLSGLVLNEQGPRARAGLRGRDVLHGCLGQRDAQPQEHRTGRSPRPRSRIIAMAQSAPSRPASGCRSRCSRPSAAASRAPVPEARVLDLVKRFLDAGAAHHQPGRHGRSRDPGPGRAAVRRDPRRSASDVECACHFHDTYGLGLANCYAALSAGVKYFESSRRGPGRLPVHGGRRRQRVHRGPGPLPAAGRQCGATSISTS